MVGVVDGLRGFSLDSDRQSSLVHEDLRQRCADVLLNSSRRYRRATRHGQKESSRKYMAATLPRQTAAEIHDSDFTTPDGNRRYITASV